MSEETDPANVTGDESDGQEATEAPKPTITVTLRALRRSLSDMGKANTGPLAGCVCEVRRDKVDGKLAVAVWVKETPADWDAAKGMLAADAIGVAAAAVGVVVTLTTFGDEEP